MKPKDARLAKTITVKNIPAKLYAQLKESAARHQRSINREVIALIEKALVPQPTNPEDFLSAAKALREKTRGYGVKQNFIDKIKKEGRP